jgi:hypothetical protein
MTRPAVRRLLPEVLFPAGAAASLLLVAALTLTVSSPGVAIDCPPCADQNDCTIDACDTTTGTCTHTSYSCNDNNDCSFDFCRGDGTCTHSPHAGGVCSDGNPCTWDDHCIGYACFGSVPTPCSDGNSCTLDSCDPSVGCVFRPTGGGCSDGDACTGGDLCVNGACRPGPPVSCNDDNTCTADSCDGQAGCRTIDLSAPCDDGQSCTVNDACIDGVCSGAVGCLCSDGDGDGFADCSSGACDPSGLPCGDCDDSTAAVHPGAAEICDHIDDDCDGTVDEGSEKTWESQGLDDPGGSAGDRYGAAIAKLGDVTGDGVDDLAIGAPTTDTAYGVDAGSVVVLSGADHSVHCRAVDPAGLAGDRLGASLAALGDLTGDGVPDLAAGAPGGTNSPGRAASVGRVTIVSGADCAVVRSCSDSIIGGYPGPGGLVQVQVYEHLGTTLAPAGDQNGDGFPDVLAGDPFTDGSGRVALFSGVNCAVLRRLSLSNSPYPSWFGSALAHLPDLTADGVEDFAIGESFVGTVSVYSGATGTRAYWMQDFAPEASQGHLGAAIAVLPDVNGDTVVDFAVGEPDGDAGGLVDSGSVVLFSGATGTFLRRCTAPDAEAGDRLGTAVAALPDIDGDGLADLAASAALDDVGPLTDAGSIVLFSSADCSLLARLPYGGLGAASGARFGETGLALVGNVAGDPTADLVAGNGSNAASANVVPGHVVLFHSESQCPDQCLPGDPDNFPGNQETCDGRDNDCDGVADEGDPGGGLPCTTSRPGPCASGTTHCLGGGIVCFQSVFAVPEICNGVDDDCNGTVPANEADADGDGFPACAECDDSNPARHPGAVEVCDLVDDDCDGVLEPDADGDGRVDCLDCQPQDPTAWAIPPEVTNVQAVLDSGAEYLLWDDLFPLAGFIEYEVFSGSLLDLRAGAGDYSSGACFASGFTFYDCDITGAAPPPGDGSYFLVRARNNCGTGTYGSVRRDNGTSSSLLPCP